MKTLMQIANWLIDNAFVIIAANLIFVGALVDNNVASMVLIGIGTAALVIRPKLGKPLK